MLSINPLLSICAVAFMPFAIFILNNARKKKREYYKKHHEIYGEMTESVLESIESVKTVRAYGMEEVDYRKTKKAIDNDTNSWWHIQMFESLFVPMFELVYAVSYFIAIGLGSYMVIKSVISPGDLVSFLLYVGMLYGPLIGLSNVLNTISSINIASVRFFEIMDQKTSSSKVFIDEMEPKYLIISVGKNNRYGHPNKDVLDNLKNSKIYRTDQDGSIMFKIKNNKLRIETCSP